MAEWYENESTVRRISNVMAREFKSVGVGVQEGMRRGGDAMSEFSESVEDTSGKLTLFGAIVKGMTKGGSFLLKTLFGPQMSRLIQDYQTALATGLDAMDAWDLQKRAVNLGTTFENLTQISKEYRNVQLSQNKTMTAIAGDMLRNQERLAYAFDNYDEMTRFFSAQLDTMGRMGIQPTIDMFYEMGAGQDRYNQSLEMSFKELQKLGVSYMESQQLLRRFMDDDRTRQRLRGKATEQERKQIIRGLMAREKEWRMLGMTEEQARRAAETLDAIAGKGPKDRMREAAKLQATLTAMGVQGAEEAANIMRLGKRANVDQQQRLQEILGSAQDVYSQIQQGDLGREMTFGTMLERAGFFDLLGDGGPMSTALTKNLEVTQEQLDGMVTLTNSQTELSTTIKGTAKTMEKVTSALDRSALGILAQSPWGVGLLAGIEGMAESSGQSQLSLTNLEGMVSPATEALKNLGMEDLAAKVSEGMKDPFGALNSIIEDAIGINLANIASNVQHIATSWPFSKKPPPVSRETLLTEAAIKQRGRGGRMLVGGTEEEDVRKRREAIEKQSEKLERLSNILESRQKMGYDESWLRQEMATIQREKNILQGMLERHTRLEKDLSEQKTILNVTTKHDITSSSLQNYLAASNM